MDNKITLSASRELLDNSKEESKFSKFQDEVFNLVKEHPVETAVGAAAALAAGTAGIIKLASREATQLAAMKIETDGIKAGTEALTHGADSIGKLIKLGETDAGKLTELSVGDRLDVMVKYGKYQPYPGLSAGNNGVAELVSGGYGPEGTRTVRGIFQIIAPGEDVIRVTIPGKKLEFPIKAR